jgi:hypothetical protein
MYDTGIFVTLYMVRVKQPGPDADHSPPSGAEVKNKWRYTCTPPYPFLACIGATLRRVTLLFCFDKKFM